MNQRQNYNPSPSLQQYLSKNKNNSEYQFKPIEKLSNDPIQTMNKGNRITKIIMKINEDDEISEMLKQLFSEDIIEKMMDPHCPDNYITKIEETIKQIEILQKKDENENKNNIDYSYQNYSNPNYTNNQNDSTNSNKMNQNLRNRILKNQKKNNLKSIPKKSQIRTKRDNLSLNSMKKYQTTNNSNISNNNTSGNYSNKIKTKSYADNLLLAHGLPLGISNEDNNKSNPYNPIKNRLSFNK